MFKKREPRKKYARLHEEHKKHMVQLRTDGMTVRQIATKYNCDVSTVYKATKKIRVKNDTK